MRTLLRAASALTLVALALMVWSVLVPTPMPVMLAMSVGQVLGTSAFAMFGLAVLIDLRRSRRMQREARGLPGLVELLRPPVGEATDSGVDSSGAAPASAPAPAPASASASAAAAAAAAASASASAAAAAAAAAAAGTVGPERSS